MEGRKFIVKRFKGCVMVGKMTSRTWVIKVVLYFLSLLTVSGCICIDLTEQERVRTSELYRSGVEWTREAEKGDFVPPVSLKTAFAWSTIPGAGQIFLAHKIEDAGLENRFGTDCKQLRLLGCTMLLFSWIPGIHGVMWVYGSIGVHYDAFHVNDYTFLKHIEQRTSWKGEDIKASREMSAK